MRSRSARLALFLAAWACSTVLSGQHRQALPGYRYEFPRDHFSHPDFQTEWWYYTGNLRARDGHRFGFELTFFRQAVDAARRGAGSPWSVVDVYLAHFALSDIDSKAFHHEERINRAGPGLAGADAATGAIWNGNWRVQLKEHAGHSAIDRHGQAALATLSLQAVAARYELQLSLESRKPPVINGVNGVSQKAAGAGEASHYISLTRLTASGRLELNGRSYEVDGSVWMDHEFFTNQLGRDQRGWDWLSLQLDDGTELMAYRLRRSDGSVDPFSAGTFVAADGRSTHLRSGDFALLPAGETWKSERSKATYPIAWRVKVPSRSLDLEVRTALPGQELTGRAGWTPTYWEGAVTATGTRNGTAMKGVGYLELTGYDKAVNLAPATRKSRTEERE